MMPPGPVSFLSNGIASRIHSVLCTVLVPHAQNCCTIGHPTACPAILGADLGLPTANRTQTHSPTNGTWRYQKSYSTLVHTPCRVDSSVFINDSLGSFWMMGSIIHPSPKGTSRVSVMARHSTFTP